MSPLPLPVRIAAGLAATAVEQARKLPEQLVGLPVTAASRAVQAGMRVQQHITELAIKGDTVFALFKPVEDTPSWARFDEDERPDGPVPVTVLREPATAPSAPHPASGSNGAAPSPAAPGNAAPGNAVGEIDEADVAQALAEPADEPGSPAALPGYDRLSLPRLRGRLRSLSLPQLETLLAHEHAHQDRAPFVTMLSNRISTVRAR